MREDYRIKLIELLHDKVEEGLDLFKNIDVMHKDYSSTILNIINSNNTAKELLQQMESENQEVENKDTSEEECEVIC